MIKELHNEQIKHYIVSKSNRIFSNSNKELYKLLLKNIFIYTNSINWLISDPDKIKMIFQNDIYEDFISFLNLNKNIRIILNCENKELNQKIFNLAKKYKNFQIILLTNKDVQDIITWDEIGYRFSPSSKKLTGMACANDPEFTKKCNLILNNLIIKK